MSYFGPSDSTRSCWDCYWYNGEKIAGGAHVVCWSHYPQQHVVARPAIGCAFFTKVPEPGEPKPEPKR